MASMKLLRELVTLPAGSTVQGSYEECSASMRRRVLEAAGGQLVVGQVILYLELRMLPYPRLVNCVVTVGEGEQRG
jgi:hypothetical protein